MIELYDVRQEDTGRVYLIKEQILHEMDWKLTTPKEVKQFADSILSMSSLAEEVVYVLAVRSNLQVSGAFLLTKGTVSCTLVGAREIFMRLLLLGATGFILLHNHPSGNPTPSELDWQITRKLKEAAGVIGIMLCDHVIIGQQGFYSFKEHMAEYWKEEETDGCVVT